MAYKIRQRGRPVVPLSELNEAELEINLVEVLMTAAAKGQWRAAAWLLERRWPERWAPGRRAPTPAPFSEADNVFAEFDELATLRRRHDGA
jgi:hypothetical protein